MSPLALQKGSLIGKYRILDEIGKGGMGVVYKALDLNRSLNVAVKVLPPELEIDPMFATRFKREAEALSDLDHPNIVKLFHVGETKKMLYYAMQFVEGRTLRGFHEEVGMLPPLRSIRIIRDVADALACAHQQGIIHRDLKPSNIMIDTHGRVWLTDFGIARIADATRLTSTGDILGTAEYMSPEQAQGHTIDHRSDIYSLGVVLYELLGGKVPFSGKSALEVMKSHQYAQPPELKRLNPHLPSIVERLVEKMMAKKPSERYPSMSAVLHGLNQCEKNLLQRGGEKFGSGEGETMAAVKHPTSGEATFKMDEPGGTSTPESEPALLHAEGAAPPAAPGAIVRCPNCNSQLAPGDLVCVQCGTNVETGRRLEMTVEHARAERESKEDPWRKLFLNELANWALLLAVAVACLWWQRESLSTIGPIVGGCSVGVGIVTAILGLSRGEYLIPSFRFGFFMGLILGMAYFLLFGNSPS